MTPPSGTVRAVELEQEMRSSYLDYAMSVIVARALPDVRDGLKPVQRRILYAMLEQGMTAGSSHKKCAAIVGEVLKNYHPHGDLSVYDTLVRMAQGWVLRYPLIDGQGNFGSQEGDPPAAYRYTEARMAPIAAELLADIEKDTVDFEPNYSGTMTQPVVLPAVLPNLLVNGAAGIAVGMATNVPPHNLVEVCDGLIHLIDSPEAGVEDLMRFVKGPDFPTGGLIYAKDLAQMYATGHGRVVQRARVIFEESKTGREQIIVTQLPYQVNPSRVLSTIAELVNDRKLEGIADLRNETGRREGTRLVIELKRDARPHTVLNNLFKHTQLQTTFGAIMLALVDGRPEVLSLRKLLQHHLDHRRDVVVRRTRFDLERARERAHIVEGLQIALQHLDAIIALIRAAADEASAQREMEGRFQLTERQSKAVVDMRLGRLTRLERDKLQAEYEELLKRIAYLEGLLANVRQVMELVREDLNHLKKRYGDPRRTEILAGDLEMNEEDLIPKEQVVVTLTHRGYIKRTGVDTYRAQRRGGRGVVGAKRVGEEDYVEHLQTASTHSDLLFFTNRGRVFRLRTHEIPDVSRQAKGLPVINLIEVDQGEKVTAMLTVDAYSDETYMVMATNRGQIKKTPSAAYAVVRRNGLIAMNLAEQDELNWVRISTGRDEILLVTRGGKALRFSERQVRPMGRDTLGVMAVRLVGDDEVAGMDIVRPAGHVLVVTERGFGKLTPLSEYAVKSRAIQGVYTTDPHALAKIGRIVGMRVIEDTSEELMVISAGGQIIRIPLAEVRISARQTRGVIIMRLSAGDSVGSIAGVAPPGDLEEG
ncbi:MAG TPA: DNA gyrase subunit A [Candidatus Micrarchaeia archaeon]|nr:DNA gyrase subunit A [Candidatus Micrarchaeia archaeon]